MTETLSKHHQKTYDAFFQHPIAHDLNRHDVVSMLGSIAETSEESNGNLKVLRNGHTFVIHSSHDKNISGNEEIMAIRHFLENSSAAAPHAPDAPGHYLVVIDHREARIFKTELHGAVPASISPYDPHGYGRNLHYVQDDSNGQRKPERKSFYEAVAKTLRGATEILLFGSATGASSAMEQLLADLQHNHPDIAARVVGSLALNAQHLTDEQLLAKAREFYATRAPRTAGA